MNCMEMLNLESVTMVNKLTAGRFVIIMATRLNNVVGRTACKYNKSSKQSNQSLINKSRY